MNSVDENPLVPDLVVDQWRLFTSFLPLTIDVLFIKVLDVSEIENLLLHFTDANKKCAQQPGR